ncbi:hypothetical protein FGD67_14980 [Colwellia sp. M166]|uniref:hypothetical protein n=1 Tax=Colwellia sp. M166 TaxID=2583805 RepID=UPI00211F25E3|nr:hypothetical protein [Colwellia sp. M166]UUO24382.1 hypothetical protein FGD67_14980 [Colwellia sp. M166]|tara:strand:+ start:4322 stop:4723 length:402 start_codon:yes stop_codon:yes gene_type:complete
MKKLVNYLFTVSILSVVISFSTVAFEMANNDMHEGMAMSHANMDKMHENMEIMRKQLIAIKREVEPKKQQELMHEHRRSMIKMMQIMHRDMADKSIAQQINMAEHHLQMMESMMPQMASNKIVNSKASNQHNH